MYFRRFVVFLLLCSIVACASTTGTENLIWRLNNRGPIPLSSENPFLAANLFVSRLAEQNQTIYGFIKYRGAPPAVGVESTYFSEPVIHFYYPEKREFFILEEFESGWVINGPERIPPPVQSAVATLTRSQRGAPVLRVQEHPELLMPEGGTDSAFARIGDGTVEQAAEGNTFDLVDQPEVVYGSRLETEIQPLPRVQGQPSGELAPPGEDSLQAAVNRLQSTPSDEGAELTPQGDLVHYVIYQGETLSIIARWYTHDRGNAGRIARINSLTNPDRLDIGDSIVIPSYLLKTQSRFTEADLKELVAISTR